MIVSHELTIFEQSFATDVRVGLSQPGQKELPSKYLYDTVGSRLFDVITALPEYGVTRAEERILREHCRDIVARLHPPQAVAELGSGSGQKARGLLEALCENNPTTYYPIEISPAALADVPPRSGRYSSHQYLGSGTRLPRRPSRSRAQRSAGQAASGAVPRQHHRQFRSARRRIDFLQEVRTLLQPGDSLLLGTDLAKPRPRCSPPTTTLSASLPRST